MLIPSIIALVIGGIFVALWFTAHVPGALLAGIAWLLYALYELLMFKGVLCSGECNIRVDLLLLWPLLLGFGLAVPVRFFMRRFNALGKK